MCSIITLLFIIFFREKPPRPPSRSSAEIKEHDFKKNFRKLITDKNVWLLGIIFAFGLGVLDSHGTVSGEISVKFGFLTTDASLLGGVYIFGGLIGAIIFGRIVDRTGKYKICILIIFFMSSATTVGSVFALKSGKIAFLASCSFI